MSTQPRCWLEIPDEHPFGIANLPYGVFDRPDADKARCGVRIGEHVLDLRVLEHEGLLDGTLPAGEHIFCKPALNAFLALGREHWRAVRTRITELLSDRGSKLRTDGALREQALVPLERVTMRLPAQIGDYTDFYSSKQHAFNVGSMFRGPENALMPNYVWIPVGYHGRASSVVVSGTPVRRPCGQLKPDDADQPTFGPSRLLDFELELGYFVGPGNPLGEPIPIERAEEHIFGVVIVNDWSARDIQKWEYVPLGPFLGKSFATTISPWVVPLEALEPLRCEPPTQDPRPLDYLRIRDAAGVPEAGWAYDIPLEVAIQSPRMPEPQTICRTNFRHMYWTIAQQVAHHTVNGCNLRPGDLLASGTISGPEPQSYGSLLELTWRGTKPIRLSDGTERKFLADGDTVIMRGVCERGGVRIGLGACVGRVEPAACG